MTGGEIHTVAYKGEHYEGLVAVCLLVAIVLLPQSSGRSNALDRPAWQPSVAMHSNSNVPETTPVTFDAGLIYDTLRIGYRVTAGVPMDIDDDGLVEFAFTTSSPDPRIGVYSPRLESWVNGPHPWPHAGSPWGVADYDSDGSLEYAFKLGDSIFLHQPETRVDQRLWWQPGLSQHPVMFWGHDASLGHLIAIETEHYSQFDGGYSRFWTIDVHAMADGQWVTGFPGILRTAKRMQSLANPREWRLGTHYENGYYWDWEGPGGEQRHLEQIRVVRPDWVVEQLFTIRNSTILYGPPDGYSLSNLACAPGLSAGGFHYLADFSLFTGTYFPRGLFGLNWNGSPYVWFMQEQYASYRAICAYDLEADGSLEWLLLLPGEGGWQRRALSDGRVIDTLTNVPNVRFASNFLFGNSHPSLYYVSDSSVIVLAGGPVTVVTEPLRTHHWISLQAWPNPFNSAVTISWPETAVISSVSIVNVLGQTLRSIELDAAKSHAAVTWDACDASGHPVASGVYFAKASGAGASGTVKLVLIR